MHIGFGILLLVLLHTLHTACDPSTRGFVELSKQGKIVDRHLRMLSHYNYLLDLLIVVWLGLSRGIHSTSCTPPDFLWN